MLMQRAQRGIAGAGDPSTSPFAEIARSCFAAKKRGCFAE
jgi:hypothetical protein